MKQALDPGDIIAGDPVVDYIECGVLTMKKEEIIESLGAQMLKYLKIAMISNDIERREHLKLAKCLQQAALIILETL